MRLVFLAIMLTFVSNSFANRWDYDPEYSKWYAEKHKKDDLIEVKTFHFQFETDTKDIQCYLANLPENAKILGITAHKPSQYTNTMYTVFVKLPEKK